MNDFDLGFTQSQKPNLNAFAAKLGEVDNELPDISASAGYFRCHLIQTEGNTH
jgi:hypothetical protein